MPPVMLTLQFHHITQAAVECHLIIEFHLLCYKWNAVSDITLDTSEFVLLLGFEVKRETELL